MLDQTTIAHLRTLKLLGFAEALQQQLAQPAAHAMAFEERVSFWCASSGHGRRQPVAPAQRDLCAC